MIVCRGSHSGHLQARHARRRLLLGGTGSLVLAACGGGSTASTPTPATPGTGPTPVWTTGPVQAPGVQYRQFDSAVARATIDYHVYLPPAYELDPAQRFPVLYWLHGSGGGATGIAPLAQRFDTAIRRSLLPACIVVFPNGMADSMWVDSRDGRVPMESVLMGELLPHVDAGLRTLARREARLVEGFSMGGYGAARLGFRYADRFAAASLLGAGPLQQTLQAEVGPPAKAAERERILATVYGGEQPYFIANSPWTLAQAHAASPRGALLLRQLIGGADDTLPANRDFQRHLQALAIPHEYLELPGVGHSTLALMDALGDEFWRFHRTAFAALARA
jgi:enterochelin esterase-like enzyme